MEKIILVLDDDPSIRLVSELTYKRLGFKVFLAEGVKTGIDLFYHNKNIGVIVSDNGMPDGSSIDFFKEIKDKSDGILKICYSGATGKERDRLVEEASKLGCKCYQKGNESISDIGNIINEYYKNNLL